MYYITIYENNTLMYVKKKSIQGNVSQIKKNVFFLSSKDTDTSL